MEFGQAYMPHASTRAVRKAGNKSVTKMLLVPGMVKVQGWIDQNNTSLEIHDPKRYTKVIV